MIMMITVKLTILISHTVRTVETWNVSQVTDMSFMFYGASTFNGDVSKWDVSQVTDMSYMFKFAYAFNRDVSKWDVSQVRHIYDMFMEQMHSMVIGTWSQCPIPTHVGPPCKRPRPLTNADVKKCIKPRRRVRPVETWDVSQVTIMHNMFLGAESFNGDVSKWTSLK